MTQLDRFKRHFKKGNVYRRADLAKWSTSVDRHLDALVKAGDLQKLSAGLYYFPKETAYGQAPPEEEVLVRSFLKDDRFLLTSPNAYNLLGIGTTQLYNTRTVYNHKRRGNFTLGNQVFSFRIKPHFPKKVTIEFLVVDLVNNLGALAEDSQEVLKNLTTKVQMMDAKKLKPAVLAYGTEKTKKVLLPLLHPSTPAHA